MPTKTHIRSAWDIQPPAQQPVLYYDDRAMLRGLGAGRYGLTLTVASDRGAFRPTNTSIDREAP